MANAGPAAWAAIEAMKIPPRLPVEHPWTLKGKGAGVNPKTQVTTSFRRTVTGEQGVQTRIREARCRAA